MRALLRRMLYFLRRSDHDAELRDEIESHRAHRQDALERDGLAPADAAWASRRAMGNVTLAVEDVGDMWLVRVLDSVQQDVRDAVRGLRKSAGFSAVVIGTLALGIGANTSLFSIFNSLIMRPLAVRDPGSLALLTSGSWSYPVWEEIKAPAGRTRALRHRRARGERAPDGDWAAHGARRAGERYRTPGLPSCWRPHRSGTGARPGWQLVGGTVRRAPPLQGGVT